MGLKEQTNILLAYQIAAPALSWIPFINPTLKYPHNTPWVGINLECVACSLTYFQTRWGSNFMFFIDVMKDLGIFIEDVHALNC